MSDKSLDSFDKLRDDMNRVPPAVFENFEESSSIFC